MKKAVLLGLVMVAVAGLAMAKGQRAPAILAFDTMYGVEGPLLGEANAIRGVVGDEAPWTIAHFIRGRLDTSGLLTINVSGLVFADDPQLVDPSLIGKNDEPTYRGLVSCLTEDAQGAIVTANVMTDGFPASPEGNSTIHQELELPNPCIAPIIFVMAGSEEKWFAVTGFEAESGSDSSRRH